MTENTNEIHHRGIDREAGSGKKHVISLAAGRRKERSGDGNRVGHESPAVCSAPSRNAAETREGFVPPGF